MDPGRLGLQAYHLVHPIMVAGIIVTAAADERVLAYPTATTEASTAWLLLDGTGLFLAGHAALKATVWRTVPWTRLGAIVVLALLGIVATSMSALLLSIMTAVVVVALTTTDRLPSSGRRGRAQHEPSGAYA